MFPRAFLLALAFFGAAAVRAQPLPIPVDVDHATFAYGGDESLLELYFAFGAAELPYVRVEQGFEATLPLLLSLRPSSETVLVGQPVEPVWQDTVEVRFLLADTAGLGAGQMFVHQVRTAVRPGEYELELIIPRSDALGRPELTVRRDVAVPDYGAAQPLRLSDVTLAASIAPSKDREDPFYKNGLAVRPNPNQLYGQGLSRLYYYAEAYRPEQAAGPDGDYTVYTYVSEANRPQPVRQLATRISRKARNPDVLVGSMDVGALPSGTYFLRIAVLNDDNEVLVEQARKFFVYNPGVAPLASEEVSVDQDFETSIYRAMPEEEVNDGLRHIALIATDRETRQARGLRELDEKRRFLADFWEKRDTDPNTPVNEFRNEFYSRLQYARERYSNRFKEGWDTDRGRTLVKYGLPTAIEPHLYDRGTIPHEIWQYNNIPGEGQSLFVFADRGGFGEFELIHSNVAGERQLPDWELQLRRGR